MLCPEVLNFKAPDSSFTIAKGSFSSNKLDSVSKFSYNHLISFVLPDTLKVPDYIANILIDDCDYYRAVNVPIVELVDRQFVKSFIKKGNLSLLSVGTRIDCDNCVCLAPNGLLVLSLDKETYQTLGVQGEVSKFHKKDRSRYVVKINLKADHFIPGKPNYERTKTALSKLPPFTLIFAWEPQEKDICPSSLAKYFHDKGCSVKLCQPTSSIHTQYSVKVPRIDLEHVESEDAAEFCEWMGMLCMGGDLNSGAPDNFLTSYVVPEPCETVGQVKILQWRGFYTSEKIILFIDALRQYLEEDSSKQAAVYVQGFSDAPECWVGRENHFYTSSSNGYVVALNGERYLLCINSVSNKQYK